MNMTQELKPVTVEELLGKSNNRSARKQNNYSHSMVQDLKSNTQIVQGVNNYLNEEPPTTHMKSLNEKVKEQFQQSKHLNDPNYISQKHERPRSTHYSYANGASGSQTR